MVSIRRRTASASLFFFLTGLAAAAQDRIVSAVDPARTVALSGHIHPKAQARFDEGPVDPSMPISYATLYLKPAAGVESFLAEQQDPSSPNYHRWLTPEQFGDRFGLTAADIGRVRSWLESQGLTVHDIARGRHWITFSGTAGSVGKAFHTEIHRYRVQGTAHFANATALSIPAAFRDAVSGVRGLHDFAAQPMYRLTAEQPLFNSSTTHYLAPDDIATIYDIGPLYAAGIDGSQQKIAIIGRTDIQLSDIRQFRKQFNLPAKDPQLVLFGPDPGTNRNDMVEADVDLEWSGAVARNADLLYIYAQSEETAAQYAVDQNLAPIITFSFGACEPEAPFDLRAIAQQANAQGITWFAASGDSGAAACDNEAPTPQAAKGPTVDTPASFPEITAVGGTEFNDGAGAGFWGAANSANSASALSYIPEKAWNDAALNNALEGTGGGASGFYSKPPWQAGPGVPNDNARDVPDVSFPASPNHYAYLLYSGGTELGVGGTSVASPSWAGLLALLEQHLAASTSNTAPGLGNINPILYRLAQATTDVFHDITVGDNKMPCEQGSPGCIAGAVGFSCDTGYDAATGLGSVDANRFVAEWNSGTATTTTLTAAPANVSLDATVHLAATVTGSGKTSPTGTVTFLADDTAIGSAPLNAGAASIDVAGALVMAGTGTISAAYSGDAVYDASSGSATVSLNLPATGSLVVPFVTPNPVYRNGTSNQWVFAVSLTEKAGVAASVTGFTIGSSNAMGFFNSTRIPANGTIATALAITNLTPPAPLPFNFTGTDATGQTWNRQLMVNFLDTPGPALAPAITLTSPLSTVQQNPQADPSCAWAQPLILQETGGFEVILNSFTVGGVNMSSQLQKLFGTQRLAPYGMLQGTFCLAASNSPSTKAYILAGSSEVGLSVNSALNANLAAAPPATSSFTPAPAVVSLVDGSTNSSAVNLSFTGGTPLWTASIAPANRTSAWLAVSPLSGSGNAPLNIQASSAGLSPGVYNALVTIQAADSVPQSISVPVMFQVGSSGNTSITAVQNAFSFQQGFAPGMLMSVYGSNLAPATTVAPKSRFPLPLQLAGVSATVNGISAPLFYVSSTQLNVQVPYESGAGPAVLAVNNNGQIASFPFTLAPAAPGIYASAISNSTGLPVTSAQPGDLLLLFLTGEGDVTPSLATGATPSSTITDPTKLPHARMPIAVTVGGTAASVLFAGIPNGMAGATQIDFTVPQGAPTGPQPVIVTVGGVASPPITLNVNATSDHP